MTDPHEQQRRSPTPIDAALVRFILAHPFDFDWSWQGLGMFRLYLSQEVRLHVWVPQMAVPDVTTIHTHPWDFESKVIFGRMINKSYKVVGKGWFPQLKDSGWEYPSGEKLAREPRSYREQRIVCGPGGGATGKDTDVLLDGPFTQTFEAGTTYFMHANEPHESIPTPGTVTVIRRTFHEDTEHAYVYHPSGTPWVSAEPRQATKQEVEEMRDVALAVPT